MNGRSQAASAGPKPRASVAPLPRSTAKTPAGQVEDFFARYLRHSGASGRGSR